MRRCASRKAPLGLWIVVEVDLFKRYVSDRNRCFARTQYEQTVVHKSSLSSSSLRLCRMPSLRGRCSPPKRYANSMPGMKTNAARLLDTLGIKYELRDYEIDPDDLTAESVARKVNLPPEQVFKTLVCRGDKHRRASPRSA